MSGGAGERGSGEDVPEPKTLADRWIFGRLDEVIESVTKDIEAYNFSRPGETLRDFTWNELADWYLEIAKVEGDKEDILSYILRTVLKLWHPFMPFVTEEIWRQAFAEGEDDFLMVEEWPIASWKPEAGSWKQDFQVVQDIVVAIRNIRATYGVQAGKRIDAVIYGGERTKLLQEQAGIISALAKLGDLSIVESGKAPENAATAVEHGVQVFIPLGDLVDLGEERKRLEGELENVKKYIGSLRKKLDNEDFIAKAPPKVVETEKAKLAEAEERLGKLEEQLKALE